MQESAEHTCIVAVCSCGVSLRSLCEMKLWLWLWLSLAAFVRTMVAYGFSQLSNATVEAS